MIGYPNDPVAVNGAAPNHDAARASPEWTDIDSMLVQSPGDWYKTSISVTYVSLTIGPPGRTGVGRCTPRRA